MTDLAGAGLTPQQLALVIELSASVAMEARPAIDQTAEKKRAYDREYRRTQRREDRTTSHDINDNHDKGSVEVPPAPPPNHSQVSPLNPPKSDEENDLALEPDHLTEAWNAGPGSRGAVPARRMGSKRRRRAVTFLRKYPVDDITEAISAAGQSDFLCGRTREGFRADIEFLFDETHMNRLLEGFYGRKSAA